MEDVVKTHLVKDGKLIVHMGRPDIIQTRFFVLTKENAKDVKRIIERFLNDK